MEILHALMQGFATAVTPANLLWALVGCALGTAVGVLPGIGPAVAVAMLLPITAKVEITSSMIFFAGIYYGAMYGGSTTSILLNTPGETGTMVTALEGFKIAFDRHGAEVDPDTQDRRVSGEGVDAARAYLAQRFPGLADAPLVHSRVCQYENSSNGDFLIDRLPGFDRVWLVGGGSGHGFKHGPAVGALVPIYVLAQKSQLLDTQLALIIVFTLSNLPIMVWMLYSHFKDIPHEILEAARMDGATLWQELRLVLLPLGMGEKQNHFILTATPPSCAFCLPGGKVAVYFRDTVDAQIHTFKSAIRVGNVSNPQLLMATVGRSALGATSNPYSRFWLRQNKINIFSAETQSTNASSSAVATTQFLRCTGLGGAPLGNFNGRLYEFLLYEGTLSDATTFAIENFLASKYGLAI